MKTQQPRGQPPVHCAAKVDLTLRRRWLAEREARLPEAIGADEGALRRAALEAEVDAGLERLRSRMPARVVEQLRREQLARRTLEAHGLPRLSLLHLEGGGGA